MKQYHVSRVYMMPALFAAVLACAVTGAHADWPAFRGPSADGIVSTAGTPGLPLSWSETENVKWKIPFPEKGWSTPVIMGGQIWLSGATPDGRDTYVIAVDAATGKILRKVMLFHTDAPQPLAGNINSYASPSPVIEPGRIYVSFGSFGTACVDTKTGQVLWRRQDLPCHNKRGPGSSPILFENLLILTMDGEDVQYLVALDKMTGQNVWKTDRTTPWDDLDAQGKPKSDGDFRKAYTTPMIVTVGGKPQMVSIGSTATFGYDPRTGRELWRVTYSGTGNVSSPIYGQGFAFINTGNGDHRLLAVRLDGQGDVTQTHVAWIAKHSARTPSPILAGGLIYMLGDDGTLFCLDAKSGGQVWKERLGGTYFASPIFADGRLYFLSQQGKAVVIEPGRACRILATNKLDAGFVASPVVEGKALILRTKTHLYRIETSSALGGVK